MAHAFQSCGNCGAPVEKSADGRAVECRFCGARDVVAVDPSALAAGLRSGHESVDELLDHLARTLSEAMPSATRVKASGGLLGKRKLQALEVSLEDAVFRMRREGAQLHAERATIVRGIALKTEKLHVDAWLGELCAALSALAASSAEAQAALARVLDR